MKLKPLSPKYTFDLGFFYSVILMVIVAMRILIAMYKLDKMCLCMVRSFEKSQEIFEVWRKNLRHVMSEKSPLVLVDMEEKFLMQSFFLNVMWSCTGGR